PRGAGGASVDCGQCHWFGATDAAGSCGLCADADSLGAAVATADFVLRVDIDVADPSPGSVAGALAGFGRLIVPVADVASLPDLPKGAIRAKLVRLRAVGAVDPAIRAWAARQSAPVAFVTQPTAIAPSAEPVDGAVILRVDPQWRVWTDGFDAASLADVLGAAALLNAFFQVAAMDAARRAPNAEAALVRSDGFGAVWTASWRALPDLAAGLREAFRAFVADGGARCCAALVAIDDTPLGQALADGQALLERRASQWSKATHGAYHRGPVITPTTTGAPDHNAVTALDWTMGWDEFQLALQRCQRLRNLVALRKAPRRVLRTFADAERQSGEVVGARDRAIYGPWLWRAAQQLRRAANVPDADATEFLNELQRADGIVRMAVAAQWAERATRLSVREERA
ncbi:MAG: hypothetical protein NZ518_03955, partial [Dehalococcoidia bacterium]|nr:hypothetical protein [Dehalococcoidia bacterium]